MTERWKYQIKTGLFWGMFMTLFNVLFEIQKKSFPQQITSPNFYIRLAVFTFFGLFVIGYFSWKEKRKAKENTK